jgi:hypothetical protein
VHGDYANELVHDTHAATTPEALFFPIHAVRATDPDGAPFSRENAAQIWEQLIEIRKFVHVMLSELRPYPESRSGYEILAFDLLIVRDPQRGDGPRVVVLEVNDRVGFQTPDCKLFRQWRDDLIAWQFRHIAVISDALKK